MNDNREIDKHRIWNRDMEVKMWLEKCNGQKLISEPLRLLGPILMNNCNMAIEATNLLKSLVT